MKIYVVSNAKKEKHFTANNIEKLSKEKLAGNLNIYENYFRLVDNNHTLDKSYII